MHERFGFLKVYDRKSEKSGGSITANELYDDCRSADLYWGGSKNRSKIELFTLSLQRPRTKRSKHQDGLRSEPLPRRGSAQAGPRFPRRRLHQ